MELVNSDLNTYPMQAEVARDFTNQKRRGVENFVHISDRPVPPRAVAVLPPVLQMRRNTISPRRPLPSRVRFGPVEGVMKTIVDLEVKEMVKKSVENKTPLFLLKNDQISTTHIDHTDYDKSNWLGLLPLGDQTTANVWLYEQENKLYAVTTKSIPSRVPLMLGYSSEYATVHGFPPESPSIDLQEALSSPPNKWWCYECQRAMPSVALLERHINSEHKEDKTFSRRRYKCQRCKRTFSRLFTLKRHVSRYCTHNAGKQLETTKSTEKTISNIESESNSFLDESRVPSEDILQNFTSTIDFNSLFDTYRTLDLTGGSKSMELIESNNQLSKDDCGMTGNPDLNFANVPANVDDKNSTVYEQPVPISNTCLSPRSKKRKFEQIQQYKTAQNSDIMYKCEDCQLIFKRRGMFVNHLWRVHRNVSTRVPLERRERRYPCAACPKLYRSAAKRDRHVRVHHPGAASARAIDSGRRACAAAACGACPRQYATRAKLLQHIRAAHPAIAPPVKKNARVQLQQ